MKYPQLVSTRAVNAISDWLVSRLEQLGVEAPQIYARFLLSLLQSSVQINDPIEYSNLETFIASRKGNNRRLHQLLGDSETLKKLTAVQCLQGIVSADQEITKIESLVDELCTKLKEIEQQNAEIGEDANELAAALLITPEQQKQKQNQEEEEDSLKEQQKNFIESNLNTHAIGKNRIRGSIGAGGIETGVEKAHIVERKGSVVGGGTLEPQVTETDPKKRYFSAFPALSKDMDEESFRALRLHAKSLTWPVERNQSAKSAVAQIAQNASDSSSSSLSQSQITKSAGEQTYNKSGGGGGSSGQETGAVAKSVVVNVKRRSRRRRNQALKNKSMQQKSNHNNKFTTTTSIAAIGGKETVDTGGVIPKAHKGKRKERYSTPTYWDTDFEGCWEMGRDLIQEFITKQNHRNNRNRSTSESAAYALKGMNCPEEMTMDTEKQPELAEKHKFTPMAEDLSKFYYEQQLENDEEEVQVEEENDEVEDALASVSELTMNVVDFLPLAAPRRLYERDVCLLKVDDAAAEEENEADFAQFKAKFNSSVEALWKDAEPVEPTTEVTKVSSEKLKSLWSHYFQNQIGNDVDGKEAATLDSSSMSLTNQSINSLHVDFSTTTSDYYSMPSNWDEVDKSLPRKMPVPTSGTDSTTPVGVFLNTSIWSEYAKPTTSTETDENFYNKVWNANQKLNQLDTNQANKMMCENTGQMNKNLLSGAEGFAPFPVSKWSEGINAGPPPPTTTTNMQQTLAPNNVGFVDCPDSSTTGSGSTTSCSSSMYPWPHHWQAPGVIGQFAQNTVMSLTDMYARDNLDASNTSSSANSSLNSPAIDPAAMDGPKVTLANHAIEGKSAFMEYARIKTLVKKTNVYPPQPPLRNTFNSAMDPIRSSNENLLTSDTTHFQPIRTYRDGHVFNICSAWDTIVYERSASGFLCLGDEKYLEYKRNDNYTVEDDAALAARAGIASTAPLYAKSNCDAATSMRQQEQRKNLVIGSKKFVLKFRMLNSCEIGCQTEDPALVAAAAAADAAAKERLNALKLTEQHPLCLLFAGGARYGMQPRPLPNTGAACSDALNALNKAIATAAKTRMQVQEQQQKIDHLNNAYVYNNNNKNNNNNINKNASSNIIENEMGKDEVDWLPATKVAQHVAAGVKNPTKCAVDCWPANQTTFMWPVYTLNENELNVERDVDVNADNEINEKEKHGDIDNKSTVANSNKELIVNTIENVVDDASAKHEDNNHDDDYHNDDDDDDDDDTDNDNEASCCEEIDNCLSGRKSPWSMRAIGKKCQLNEQTKRKRLNHNNNNNNHNNSNNNNNNNNNDDDDDDDDNNNNNNDEDGDEHTLWGMCAACHSENKSLSLPANRLLRDELNQEADEIMNELKNMQDLYIGRNAGTDDEEDNENEHENNLIQMSNDNDEEQQVTGNWCTYSPIIIKQQQHEKKENDKPNNVLQQMNRFIEDWLRPSTFQGEKHEFWHTNKVKSNNVVDDNANINTDVNVDVVDKKPNFANIWHVPSNPQPNIWQTTEECSDIAMQLDAEDREIEKQQQEEQQHEEKKSVVVEAWKPLEFLRQLNVVETPAQQSKDDTFLSKLSWEHEHLAAIWKNATPTPSVGVDNNWAVLDKNNKNRNISNIIMPPKNFQDQPHDQQQQKNENLDIEKQQSERVRAFLQHLGVFNKKDATLIAKNAIDNPKTTAVAATTNNTPKSIATTLGNRKRRHSESLNYLELMEDHMLFCTTHNNNMLLNNDNNNMFFMQNVQNNNNGNGNGNGNGNEKCTDTDNDGITKMDTNLANDYGDDNYDNFGNDNGNNNGAAVIVNNSGGFHDQKQTIITCKYWATTADNKNNNNNNTSNSNELINSFAMEEDAAATQLACQFDKNNTSILRHVTTEIVARPLTR